MPIKKVITSLERIPVGEQVARQLMGLVQSGSLKAGEKLPTERELSALLEVSRPSLREALRSLSLLGVLKIRQGGGVYVSELDPESLLAPLHFFISLDEQNLEDLFEARLVVEAENARRAASKITPEALARLKQCVAAQRQANNSAEMFIEFDNEFHKIINESVDNTFLDRFATSLHIMAKASRELTGHLPGAVEQSSQDHQRIAAAIEAGDGEGAAEAMKTHLNNGREALHRGTAQPQR